LEGVSVIIPHHNRPALLKEAIDSVRAQTVEPLEIIVVDDCSRPEVRQELQKLSGLATIISTPGNLGLGGARNYGVSQAKGRLLAFLDDDDLFLPRRLETGLRYMEAHPGCDAVGGGFTMVSADRTEYWGEKVTRTVTLGESFVNTASMVQSMLISRDAFWKIGGFDPRLRYLPDYDLGIRLLGAGLRMDFIAEPLFIYHLGGRDQLTARWRAMLREQLVIIHRHRQLCRRAFGPLGPLKIYARYCLKYGEIYGGIIGRSIWATGLLLRSVAGPCGSE